jgi:hypothetical protein
MAANKTAKKQSTSGETEAKVVELAEQLGRFLGTVRGKADGWLENDTLSREITRIRDGASELLAHVNRASESARQAVTGAKPEKAGPVVAGPAARKAAAKPKPSTVVAPKPSRGAVDAPGKKHRKPPPQERLDKRMGEPVGKQMGQKNFKMGTGKRRISG